MNDYDVTLQPRGAEPQTGLVDATCRPMRRALGTDAEACCPGCRELVKKVGKHPDRGFGAGARILCGACGYDYGEA